MQSALLGIPRLAICPAGGGRALSPAVRKQAIVLKGRTCRQGADVSRSLDANGPRSRMPDISAFPDFGRWTLDFGLGPLNNRWDCANGRPRAWIHGSRRPRLTTFA